MIEILLLYAKISATFNITIWKYCPPPPKKKTMTHAWQKRLGHSKYEFDCICCPHNVSFQIFLYNSDPESLTVTTFHIGSIEMVTDLHNDVNVAYWFKCHWVKELNFVLLMVPLLRFYRQYLFKIFTFTSG